MAASPLAPVTVSTAVFDGHPMELAFDTLAALGATHVEPAFIEGYVAFDETAFTQTGARRLREALAASGLGCVAVSAHSDLGAPEAPDRLRRRIGFAAELGARILISNASRADRRDALRATIEATLPGCAEAGLVLALENPGHGERDLIPNGAAGAALVAEFASPALRLNYDIGNALTYGARRGSAAADLEAALPAAVHLHVKDVAEHPAGPATDWSFCAVGDGIVGYAGLLERMRGSGLPLGLELPLRLRRPGRGAPVRTARPVELPVIREAIRRSLRAVRGV